jgi:putative aminopeptidase FrvX
MVNELVDLLKRLTQASGVAGYEFTIGKMVYDELNEVADSIITDSLGNVIALKKSSLKNAPKVMIVGHMDEIGLIVKYVDEKGFVYFERLGGVTSRSLYSQAVNIHTKKGPVCGLVFCKPAETPEEATKMPDLKTYFIDVGAKNRAQVEKMGICVGDVVTFERVFRELGDGGVFASKAFDDRVGVAIMIEVMKKLQRMKIAADVYGVGSVQEEVGARGAKVAAYSIAPDLAIAVDITPAQDIPGVAEKDRLVKLGAGPAIKVMDSAGSFLGLISHPKVRELLISAAEEEKIPFQLEILTQGSTDASTIHLTREGVPSGVVSVPTRYAHSYEVVKLDDVKNSVKLLVAAISRVSKSFKVR